MMPSVDLSLRYPVARTTYVRETGAIRQESIANVFKELFPFAEVASGHVNANGTDITITYNGHTYKAEVFNENEMSYIDNKRAYGTVRNLQNCDASMFFCNFGNFGSENAEKTLANTPTLRIGWQELKREHHAFYRKKKEVYKRKVSNGKSHRKLKQQILSFLIAINFPLLMYIKYTRINIINRIITFFSSFRIKTNIAMRKFAYSNLKNKATKWLFWFKNIKMPRLSGLPASIQILSDKGK